MDVHKFDNEVVCRAVYAWLKGDGYEPYSPVVASLTCLVMDIVRAERARHEYVWRCDDDDDEEFLKSKLQAALAKVRTRSTSHRHSLHLPNMDAARGAFEAIAWVMLVAEETRSWCTRGHYEADALRSAQHGGRFWPPDVYRQARARVDALGVKTVCSLGTQC